MNRVLESNSQIMYLSPIENADIDNFHKVVVLYQVSGSEAINVGTPALASYYPAMANMYGFKTAEKKMLYLNLTEQELADYCDKPIFRVVVTNIKTIDLDNAVCINGNDSLFSSLTEKEDIYKMA